MTTPTEAKTRSEHFIATQVAPQLAPDEAVLHTGYLMGEIGGSDSLGVMLGAARLRACFIALSQTRAFFLWNKPGRVGAFSPILECGSMQIVERRQIAAKVVRSALFSKSLWLSLDGTLTTFHLKRKVRDLPDQPHMIDALCVNPMT